MRPQSSTPTDPPSGPQLRIIFLTDKTAYIPTPGKLSRPLTLPRESEKEDSSHIYRDPVAFIIRLTSELHPSIYLPHSVFFVHIFFFPARTASTVDLWICWI